jgi:tagatose 1,6-diphosphate aldolase
VVNNYRKERKDTMTKITEGKYKGLMAVSDKNGIIRAAAMDQRGSLRKAIAKEKGVEEKQVTDAMMSEFKVAVSKVLTPHASAILLDPEVGLEAVKARAKNAGVLLAYEQTGYDHTLPGRVPTLIPNWTVKKAIEAGADCMKVLIYYTPFEDSKANDIKHAFVSRIGAECAYYDIPYFLEFVGYDPKGQDEKGIEYAKKKPEIVIKSMQEFSKPEYNVDVLKVEIPINLQCVEGAKSFKGQKAYSKASALDWYRQADQAAKNPYIYLSAGVSDEQFRESLELAITAGTNFAGVLCGRATWKEGIPIYATQGLKAFEAWLADRGVKNITALNQVLDKGARAWWDKYGGKDQIQIVNKLGQSMIHLHQNQSNPPAL